ncbi:MAG: hypothetical protein GQ564_02850 [Bacteroidales bacterium]|nr:hypothetical protein [Bacteroidales bacterium]
MKNLEDYGVVSLEAKEMKEIDGGTVLGLFFLGIVIGIAIGYSVASN